MTALPPDDETIKTLLQRLVAALYSPRAFAARSQEIIDYVVRLRAELSALRAEREKLREDVAWWKNVYVVAKELLNEYDDALGKVAAPQAHPGEESAAIPASDSTVPPGDGAAACKG